VLVFYSGGDLPGVCKVLPLGMYLYCLAGATPRGRESVPLYFSCASIAGYCTSQNLGVVEYQCHPSLSLWLSKSWTSRFFAPAMLNLVTMKHALPVDRRHCVKQQTIDPSSIFLRDRSIMNELKKNGIVAQHSRGDLSLRRGCSIWFSKKVTMQGQKQAVVRCILRVTYDAAVKLKHCGL
jgi:hypothetical protein